MENEKNVNSKQDNKLKIPWSWKSILLAFFAFFVLFYLFTIVNFVNLSMIIFAINVLIFADSNPIGNVAAPGDAIGAIGEAFMLGIGIIFFALPFNLYFSFYGTKCLLTKWYNKVYILQKGRLLLPTCILFMMVFSVNNIIWKNILVMIKMNTAIYSSFFTRLDGYAILVILFLSLHVSQKIIKKLAKGVTHG